MLYAGCHLSAAEGFLAMGRTALSLRANTFQFFTRNPRGSRARAMDPADAAALRQLLAVKRADNAAQSPDDRHRLADIQQAEDILDGLLARQQCFSLRDLAVKGGDMAALGLRGREIGDMLRALLDAVLDGALDALVKGYFGQDTENPTELDAQVAYRRSWNRALNEAFTNAVILYTDGTEDDLAALFENEQSFFSPALVETLESAGIYSFEAALKRPVSLPAVRAIRILDAEIPLSE